MFGEASRCLVLKKRFLLSTLLYVIKVKCGVYVRVTFKANNFAQYKFWLAVRFLDKLKVYAYGFILLSS